jgi:hypothetical protein
MRKTASLILLAGCLGAFAPCALALTEGKTTQGEPYVTGGIGSGEEESLKQRSNQFSLRILVAATKSGAYLANVKVQIVDVAGKKVLETTTDGPWLLANLKLGEYKVSATYGGQTRQQATKIHPGDRHEIVFRFDEPVDRLPKGEKQ